MKEERVKQLERYYRGETSLEEEKLLKEEIMAAEGNSPEKDFFSLCAGESQLPPGLEKEIFAKVDGEIRRKRTRIRLYSLISVAASLALIITLYSGYRTGQKNEVDFQIIEQALYNVSEILQPELEEPEMLVLWVDNNVEIIVN
ncbi:MAG: hypothetical protein WBK43_01575 [Prolixibacteraceae bacterium]|jgi:hypothetical protein|nr:hypothetical protein [Bacteroidota bacterium]HOF54888.1 hypothetical protein [Prolixibacteraceae bacterium]HOR99853.1 hypothetical protein [Prolixibacteraceae bacterium]HOS89743.1 hypothetical protein [Prolixibacteraceae bacterium]HPI35407.1 hypothetical protein [Prolixibacteraceae bacterium]